MLTEHYPWFGICEVETQQSLCFHMRVSKDLLREQGENSMASCCELDSNSCDSSVSLP